MQGAQRDCQGCSTAGGSEICVRVNLATAAFNEPRLTCRRRRRRRGEQAVCETGKRTSLVFIPSGISPIPTDNPLGTSHLLCLLVAEGLVQIV